VNLNRYEIKFLSSLLFLLGLTSIDLILNAVKQLIKND